MEREQANGKARVAQSLIKDVTREHIDVGMGLFCLFIAACSKTRQRYIFIFNKQDVRQHKNKKNLRVNKDSEFLEQPYGQFIEYRGAEARRN